MPSRIKPVSAFPPKMLEVIRIAYKNGEFTLPTAAGRASGAQHQFQHLRRCMRAEQHLLLSKMEALQFTPNYNRDALDIKVREAYREMEQVLDAAGIPEPVPEQEGGPQSQPLPDDLPPQDEGIYDDV